MSKAELEIYLAAAEEHYKLLQVWFWDECSYSLKVIRRKQWARRGKPKKVSGQRGRGNVNVMGAIRHYDKKVKTSFIEKGDSNTFYEGLKNLYNAIKTEWIMQGGLASTFKRAGPRLVVVLDNASYHCTLSVLQKVRKEMPNLHLYFLPAYSPDMNMMELVWHSSKEYIANRLFRNKEELKDLINRLLNRGELKIDWGRRIKNKGNSINAS